MPPLPQWLQGAHAIGASIGGMVLVPGSSGQFRVVPTQANGLPAFALYRRDDAAIGTYRPLSLHLVEIVDGRIASIIAFLDASLFEPFGLPATLPAPDVPGT
jgi:RNA polymerase sigma-70 factor (ECF subfamily)